MAHDSGLDDATLAGGYPGDEDDARDRVKCAACGHVFDVTETYSVGEDSACMDCVQGVIDSLVDDHRRINHLSNVIGDDRLTITMRDEGWRIWHGDYSSAHAYPTIRAAIDGEFSVPQATNKKEGANMMRAKMVVETVKWQGDVAEAISFRAVGPSSGYPADGSDEDNSYARWTPSAELKMIIANPALIGKLKVGQTYYVDFTEATKV